MPNIVVQASLVLSLLAVPGTPAAAPPQPASAPPPPAAYDLTGDRRYLDTARIGADPVHRYWDHTCGDGDVPSFKGAFVRGLGKLNQALPDRPYTAYLKRPADTAHARDRSSSDSYDQPWAGPFQRSDAARRHSAVDLMNAAS